MSLALRVLRLYHSNLNESLRVPRNCTQANAVGAFVDVPGVSHKLIANPVRLSSHEGLGGSSRGAPRLGEHNAEVLAELGLTAAEIASLKREGVTN